MAVEVWATIQSQLSEQIMFDLKKINPKPSASSSDKSDNKVGDIIKSRVSVRALDVETLTQV